MDKSIPFWKSSFVIGDKLSECKNDINVLNYVEGIAFCHSECVTA